MGTHQDLHLHDGGREGDSLVKHFSRPNESNIFINVEKKGYWPSVPFHPLKQIRPVLHHLQNYE